MTIYVPKIKEVTRNTIFEVVEQKRAIHIPLKEYYYNVIRAVNI